MKTVKLIIDGKEINAQINEEDLKVIEKKKDRADKGSNYYYFNSDLFFIENTIEEGIFFDECCYDNGNYFLNEEDCKNATRVVSLWLRMKRFANEYNKENLKFTDDPQEKYFIAYDFANEDFRIDRRYNWKDMFQIYFNSEETAQKAINEFYDELMWYFTEYEKDNKITPASKEIQYEVNVGSGCANGTVFVDEGATDEEIRLAIMDDLYDVDYHEVMKEEN